MISINRLILVFGALLCAYTQAAKGKYDEDLKIEDVRGGVSLTATYPPNLVDTLGNRGQINVKLGNFGHIQYGTSM